MLSKRGNALDIAQEQSLPQEFSGRKDLAIISVYAYLSRPKQNAIALTIVFPSSMKGERTVSSE
ncbi:MAG: hypothetical protein AB1589_09870 [Cyanobacteriota bacterium]